MTLYKKRGFTTKEKVSSNLPRSLINGKKHCYTRSSLFNKFIRELATCGPWLIFEIKKTSSSSSKLWSRQKKLEKKYYFVKNIVFIVSHHILILINILFTLFSYCFANFTRLLRNLCIQISGMLDGMSLSLISFVRRLITITSMASKRTQVVHVNKGSDKIVIVQSTLNIATGPMTRSKTKSTSSLSTK